MTDLKNILYTKDVTSLNKEYKEFITNIFKKKEIINLFGKDGIKLLNNGDGDIPHNILYTGTYSNNTTLGEYKHKFILRDYQLSLPPEVFKNRLKHLANKLADKIERDIVIGNKSGKILGILSRNINSESINKNDLKNKILSFIDNNNCDTVITTRSIQRSLYNDLQEDVKLISSKDMSYHSPRQEKIILLNRNILELYYPKDKFYLYIDQSVNKYIISLYACYQLKIKDADNIKIFSLT